ncbi:MAG: hypothetical protein MRY59_10940 [Aquisalinus sp.]|nr:hypothetical protein [Aquisalinus sp.]
MKTTRFCAAAISALLVITGAATAQDQIIYADPELNAAFAELPKTRGYQGRFDPQKNLPKRLETIQLAEGTQLDLRDYLEKTRLTNLPGMTFEPSSARAMSLKPVYLETLTELDDALIVERKLTIQYDPGACPSAGSKTAQPARKTQLGKPVTAQSRLCLQPKSGTLAPEMQQMVAGMRAELQNPPKGYQLPDGTTAEEARNMSDAELINAYFNNGSISYQVISTIPKRGSAVLNSASPAVALANAARQNPLGKGNYSPEGFKLTPEFSPEELQERLDAFGSKRDTYDPRNNALIDPKALEDADFPDLVPGKDELFSADKAGAQYRSYRRQQYLRENIQITKEEGLDISDVDLARLAAENADLDREMTTDISSLPVDVQNRILEAALDENIVLDGKGALFHFLSGYTYSHEIRDKIGITFYEGGRFTDPIFIYFHYWVNPYFGIRMPFRGTISSQHYYDREIENGTARYRLNRIEVPVILSGEDVDANGQGAFASVGLPRDEWFGGSEFSIGINIDCSLHYDLPFIDAKWIRYKGDDHFSRDLSSNFAPPLGPSQSATLTSINLPYAVSGLGIDGWFGGAGLDFGADLDGVNGRVLVNSRLVGTPYVLQRNRSYFEGQANETYVIGVQNGRSVFLDQSENYPFLQIDNRGYRVGLEVVPVMTPRLTIDLGVYEFNWSDPIRLNALAVSLGSAALPPHAGVTNSTEYQVALQGSARDSVPLAGGN